MCCRYFIRESDPDLLPIIDAALKSPLIARFAKVRPAPLVRFGEVKPTDLVAVIASDRQQKAAVFPMTWGFTVSGRSAPLINARSETASEKQSFSEAWKQHRCIIPASWYFEWQHYQGSDGKIRTGDKYAVKPRDAEIIWLAGLYRIEERNGVKYPVFTVLTREPTEDLRKIHDRMPVLLPEQSVDEWISPKSDPEGVAKTALTDMVYETED